MLTDIILRPNTPEFMSVSKPIDPLENMVSTYRATHQFWNDSVSLRDAGLFRIALTAGHKQTTDVYLLGLCQQMGGIFVTLDDKMTTNALVSPHPDLLHKI